MLRTSGSTSDFPNSYKIHPQPINDADVCIPHCRNNSILKKSKNTHIQEKEKGKIERRKGERKKGKEGGRRWGGGDGGNQYQGHIFIQQWRTLDSFLCSVYTLQRIPSCLFLKLSKIILHVFIFIYYLVFILCI